LRLRRFKRGVPQVPVFFPYTPRALKTDSPNAYALLGLANVSKEQVEPELAKSYAARCYEALMDGGDFLKDPLLEMLLSKWPEVLPPKSR